MKKDIRFGKVYFRINFKKICVLLVLFSILGVYLYFANIITIHLTKQKNEVIIHVTKPYQPFNNIIYAIDKFEINATDKNMIQITGWAFISALDSNESRKVKLVLSGTHNTYECDALLSFRKDIIDGMDDKINEINRDNDNLGMLAYFSALNLKEDIYQLGIYVQENEKEWGFTHTDIYFIKDKGQLHRYYGQIVENMIVDTNEDIIYILDELRVDESNNEFDVIKGAIIKKGLDTTKQEVYVQLQNNQGDLFTYSTIPYNNNTFEEFYNDNKYANAGFMCAIPKKVLKEGEYTVDVILQTDLQQVAPYKTYISYDKNGERLKEESKIIKKDISIETVDKMITSIDSIQMKEKELYIGGWTIEEDKSTFGRKVLIQLINEADKSVQFFTSKNILRPDIAQAYSMSIGYLNSGFECRIPIEYIKEGKYGVGIIIGSEGYKRSPLQTKINYNENKVSIEEITVISEY